MTPSASSGEPDGSGASDDSAPETDRLPTASGDHAPTAATDNETSRTREERARAIAVLDEPLDDKDLDAQIRRPGMSRSTRLLLGLLVVIVVFAVGAFVGRYTAPDTGPGSSPDVVGTVESVVPGTLGTSQLTVRTADGNLTVLSATAGTSVGTARPGGVQGLRPGERVTVGAEVNLTGSLDATNVVVSANP